MNTGLEPSLDDGAKEAMNQIAASLTAANTETPPEIVESSLNPEATIVAKTTPETIEEAPIVAEKVEDVILPKEKEAEIETKTAADFLSDDDDKKPVIEDAPNEDKAKLHELEQLLGDEDTQIAIKISKEAKKQGKNVIDFIKGIGGEDVNKLSTRQLFERKLDKYPELTEDERNYELETFDGMSKLQQLERTSDIKNEILNSNKSALEQFTSTSEKTTNEFDAVIKQEAKKAAAELEDVLSQKDYKNLDITPERKRAIKKYVNENLKNDSEGRFNVSLGVKTAIMALYEKEFLDANRNVAKSKAREEIFKEVTRPSKETSSTSVQSAPSEEELYKKAQNEYFEIQKNKNNLTVN